MPLLETSIGLDYFEYKILLMYLSCSRKITKSYKFKMKIWLREFNFMKIYKKIQPFRNLT